MNINHNNHNRMTTRSSVQPGHIFIAMEYKPKPSIRRTRTITPPQTKNEETTLHYCHRFPLNVQMLRLGMSKAKTLINFDHYIIDEVIPLLEAKKDTYGNILRSDYNTIMIGLVKGRGSIAAKDTRTIEMIIDNIFSTFVKTYSLESVLNNQTCAPFRQVAIALSLFCVGSREDKVRACFDLFGTPDHIHTSSIEEFLFSVFSTTFSFGLDIDTSTCESYTTETMVIKAIAMAKACTQQIAYNKEYDDYNTFVTFDEFTQWYV